MEEKIISTFEKPEIPSVAKTTNGVKSVIEFLNTYRKALCNPNFNSADGFLRVKINETLEIGKRFREVTEKSTEIDLQMAEYAGRVSYYIKQLIDSKPTGKAFSNAMKRLQKHAERIYDETVNIKKDYKKISDDLQIIHGECTVRYEEIDQQKKQIDVRAVRKKTKEHKNEKIAVYAGVATTISAVVFPPAAAFFGGIAAIGTWQAKANGKKAKAAIEKGSNLQNSLDSIKCFQGVIKDILDIVGIIEAFWKNQVAKVQNLVETAKECDDLETDDIELEAARIVGQWKEVEDNFRAYSTEISKELKKCLMIA